MREKTLTIFFRLWLSPSEKAALKKASKLRKQSMSSIIRYALNKELAKMGLFSEEENAAILSS